MCNEMPREKLLRLGAEALKNEELLSVVLGTGYNGKDVFTLARELTKAYPDGGLFRLPYKDLSKIKGIGPAKAATISAAAELGRRCIAGGSYPPVTKPSDILPIVAEYRFRKKENFIVFYLNGRNQVICSECVSVGTLNASLVHPREVFEPAIRHLAAGVIFAHNHPSGDCTPSEDDIEITKRLVDAGRLIGIEVLDHLIIGQHGYLSFKEKGLI